MSTPPRVLVADDHPALREGVRKALEASGYEVCAEADSGPGAVEAALREHPDICLLDIQMPGNGIAAAAEISTRVPETAVVMLTVSVSERDLFEALSAGAAGYLLKDTDPARLAHALTGVLRGEAALPRSLVARLIKEFQRRDAGRRLRMPGGRRVELTPREWDVLELLRDGCSTAEIATRLFVSAVTVRRHVGSIVRKVGAENRGAAVAMLGERE